MPLLAQWRERYVWYRTATLSAVEHSLICDLMAASKGFAITLVVLFGIGLYAAWGYVSGWWIGLFLAAFAVEASLKLTFRQRFMRLPDKGQKRPIWRLIYYAGTTYSALVYGLAGLAMFAPMPDENRLLLIGVYCVIVSALVSSVATTTAFFQPVARWITLILVAPTIIALLLSGKPLFWLLSVVMVIGCVGAVYFSFLSQNRYAQVSALNERNKVLVTKLSAQQQMADDQKCLAEQAVIDKSRFIAAASHDLRQPLHAMTLFHHALRHKSENESNKRLFDAIDTSTLALNAMFDSLLDVSKLDANVVEPEYEPLSIQRVFVLLQQEFQPIAAQKGLYLNISGVDVSFYTDQTLFIRILRNLISNALKFTHQGGVSLEATLSEEHLVVVVSDTGVGIPDGEHEQVFKEFYQLDLDQRQLVRGVGLGLSIVKRLSALLGLQVQLVPTSTGGTRASLTISCAELVEEQESIAEGVPFWSTGPCELSGLIVVFIDDDEAIRHGMHALLNQWRCRAICAADADEALAQLADLQIQPDFIIGDYQLSGSRSGLDAIQTLRTEFDEGLPGILVSGATSPDDLLDINASGLLYLTKPVRPEKLHDAMLALMSTRTHACV